jgi:vacuolar protein sorting-associated protein IST1
MFSHVNYSKLKTNLKLAVQRLKLLEKKKAENAKKFSKDIADFIAQSKNYEFNA